MGKRKEGDGELDERAFVRVPVCALSDDRLRSREKLLYGVFVEDSARSSDSFSTLSNRELSQTLNVCQSAVSRHISALEKTGYIRVSSESWGGNRKIYPLIGFAEPKPK